jgi:hypothetical protein
VNKVGNQVHPVIQALLPNNNAVSHDDSTPFTQQELFGYGFNCMKVNFNIFPSQHNHQV